MAVVGDQDPDLKVPAGLEVLSLVAVSGSDRAFEDTARCLKELEKVFGDYI